MAESRLRGIEVWLDQFNSLRGCSARGQIRLISQRVSSVYFDVFKKGVSKNQRRSKIL